MDYSYHQTYMCCFCAHMCCFCAHLLLEYLCMDRLQARQMRVGFHASKAHEQVYFEALLLHFPRLLNYKLWIIESWCSDTYCPVIIVLKTKRGVSSQPNLFGPKNNEEHWFCGCSDHPARLIAWNGTEINNLLLLLATVNLRFVPIVVTRERVKTSHLKKSHTWTDGLRFRRASREMSFAHTKILCGWKRHQNK